MKLNEYQISAKNTGIYKNSTNVPNIVYAALGLSVETSEVLDKIKKVLRDNDGMFDDSKKLEITKELGDVLWYMANLSDDLGFTLEEIADMNLSKVNSIKERNMIHGESDNR